MKDRQKEAAYAARTIRTFLDGGGRDHDWDGFTSCSLRDAELDRIRRRAGAVDLPLGQEERAALLAMAEEADRLAVSNVEPRRERPRLSWWQPLPLWLKAITVLVAYPAWLFIAYCVLTGQAKSIAAICAFVAFSITALLHIMFDRRNRRGGQEYHGGLDLTGGEE